MDAEGVSAKGEYGSDTNYGLFNSGGGYVTLHGGSFTGGGGAGAYGIVNTESGTTLEANYVTVLGRNGLTVTYGLSNDSGAAATLHGGHIHGQRRFSGIRIVQFGQRFFNDH